MRQAESMFKTKKTLMCMLLFCEPQNDLCTNDFSFFSFHKRAIQNWLLQYRQTQISSMCPANFAGTVLPFSFF